MEVRTEIADVIKSLRWLSEELRDEKRGVEADMCAVAADRLESLNEDVDEWVAIFDMMNNRENRHRYLDWWREKNGESELTYPDGDEPYKDFFEMKARAEKSEAEVERLERICNSYALQYGTVRDQQKVINEAKVKVAIKIFAEIANKLLEDINTIAESIDRITDPDAIDGQYEKMGLMSALLYDLAELKKKYSEVKNDE